MGTGSSWCSLHPLEAGKMHQRMILLEEPHLFPCGTWRLQFLTQEKQNRPSAVLECPWSSSCCCQDLNSQFFPGISAPPSLSKWVWPLLGGICSLEAEMGKDVPGAPRRWHRVSAGEFCCSKDRQSCWGRAQGPSWAG